MKGNFASIEIPAIEIPGSKPLIYTKAKDLIAEITAKDEFFIDDIEEEFLMFTAEMCDRNIRKQDGPHQTLRWRRRARDLALRQLKKSVDESDKKIPVEEVAPAPVEEIKIEE